MWLIFAFLAFFCELIKDIFYKRITNNDLLDNYLKIRVACCPLIFLAAVGFFLLNFNNPDYNPFLILRNHPLIFAVCALSIFTQLFYLLSLRYLGLYIWEALSSLYGVVLFISMVIVNQLTGKLSDIANILTPFRLFLISTIIICLIILPNCEIKTKNHSHNNRMMILGFFYLAIALLLDAADSLVTSIVFSETDITAIQFFLGVSPISILYGIIIYFFIHQKCRNFWDPIDKDNRNVFIASVFYTGTVISYLLADDLEPIKMPLLWIIYPILPMIVAKLFLKEKYTRVQNVCIIIILVAAIIFNYLM